MAARDLKPAKTPITPDLAGICADFLKDAGCDPARVDAFVAAGLARPGGRSDLDNDTIALAIYRGLVTGMLPGIRSRLISPGINPVGPDATFRVDLGNRGWEAALYPHPSRESPSEFRFIQAGARVGAMMRRDLGLDDPDHVRAEVAAYRAIGPLLGEVVERLRIEMGDAGVRWIAVEEDSLIVASMGALSCRNQRCESEAVRPESRPGQVAGMEIAIGTPGYLRLHPFGDRSAMRRTAWVGQCPRCLAAHWCVHEDRPS
jgi:hypothetical protein